MKQSKRIISLLVLCLFSAKLALADATYYLVRHAEKQKDGTKDPALTQKGHKRAEFLAKQLSLTGISKIYSTDYKRTRATAKPLADILGLELTPYDASQLKEFAQALRQEDGNILIVGHSNTTPVLAEMLSGKSVDAMQETEYENLYQVVIIDGKARLSRFRMFPMEADPSNH